MDDARNKLLHGEDKEKIEQDLGVPWEKLSDDLGKVTWFALLDILGHLMIAASSENIDLALVEASTFVHYHVTMRTDLIIGAHHANPSDPQIDEFMLPGFEVNMIVNEDEKGPREQQIGRAHV